MKTARRPLTFLVILLALLVSAPRAPAQIPPGYEVVQVTNTPYGEFLPRINNAGQIVFTALLGRTNASQEIFLYDQGQLIRLTDNGIQDHGADVNDDGNIVWSSAIGPVDPNSGEPTAEIVMYSKGVLTRLTDNAVHDASPRINNRGEVVWKRFMGRGCNGTTVKDIYHYDGRQIRPITTDAIPQSITNQGAVINDHGQIVWTRYNFCPDPWESDILMYDRGATTRLTDTQVAPQGPSINNHGVVAWFHRPQGALVIQLWEAGVVRDLTDSGHGPGLNDAGHVSFERWHNGTGNWQQWLYRGGAFWQLSNDPFWNRDSDLNELGEVVWEAGPSLATDIRYLRRMPIGDLNCDGVLNGADIDPFFFALGDPSGYRVAFPGCDLLLGDVNADGRVNGADIDPFFKLLGG